MPNQPQFPPAIHFFDADGYATGETGSATPGDVPGSYYVPANATTEEPPESVPEGMAARWNGMAWDVVPELAPAEKRASAYRAEADPLLATHQQYQAEADAWAGLEGTAEYDEGQAEKAQGNAAEALAAYLDKKREIRERFPDANSVE